MSVGPGGSLQDFQDLTRTRLAPVEKSTPSFSRQTEAEAKLLPLLTTVTRAYQHSVPYLSLLATMACAASVVLAGLRRRSPPLLAISFTLLVAMVTRVAIVAMVDVTSFPALNVGYLSSAYPLLLAFIVLSGPALVEAVRLPRSGTVKGGAPVHDAADSGAATS